MLLFIFVYKGLEAFLLCLIRLDGGNCKLFYTIVETGRNTYKGKTAYVWIFLNPTKMGFMLEIIVVETKL